MEKWKNELKEQMDGFRMDPPEGLWDSIEEKVTGKKAAAVPWLRYTAIAAGIAIIVGSGMFLTKDIRETERQEIAAAPVTEVEEANLPKHITDGKLTAWQINDADRTTTGQRQDNDRAATRQRQDSDRTTTGLASGLTAEEPAFEAGSAAEVQNVEAEPVKQAGGPPDSNTAKAAANDGPDRTLIPRKNEEAETWPAVKDIAAGENTGTPAAKDGNGRLPEDSGQTDFPDEGDIIEIHESRQRKSRLAGNISFSGTPGSSSSHSGYSEALVSRSALSTFSFGNDPMADIATYNTGQEINTQYRHYQPVRIGVSVSYSLGRFSLESGIAYSCLYSKIRSGSERYYYTGSQQLHYIGIPLNIGYSIWDNGRLAVYVSAGGTLEKCLGGSQKTEYSYNGAPGITQHDKLDIKPLQWSVQAVAGLQYSITGLVGLYIEPGISYHFRNSTSIQSIYTDRPLNFSLAIGVRFNIL